MTVEAARAHRGDQATLAHGAARRASAAFREGIDPDDIRGSWRATLPQILGLTTAAQRAAANLSDGYLDQVIPGETLARLAPDALSGVASDGRDLSALLTQPVITALAYLAGGRALADALGAASAALEMIVGTQVSDAGRVADLVGTTARPSAVAYTRVVTLPACARCIVLAGREYSWSEGFERHPRCDCVTLPLRSGEQPPGGIDPRELFDSMSPQEQRRRFGEAGAEAIRQGADLDQVVNARRGMSVAGGRAATTEGMTRRGLAARRMGADYARRSGQRYARSTQTRLMPEQILAEADGDRDAAIEGLIAHGYLSRRDARAGDQPATSDGSASGASAGEPPSTTPPAAPPPEDDGRPPIGALVPTDDDDAEERRGEIEDAVATVMEGDYTTRDGTVFTISADTIEAEENELRVSADIRADSIPVGTVVREFYRERDGTLWVDHAFLRINDEYQGRGFATVFNRHLERWYGESGVDRIEIVAGLDRGGYVWATQGFEFRGPSEAESILERLDQRVTELTEWLSEHEDDEDVTDEEYQRVEDLVEAAGELMARAESEEFGSEEYPTAEEISQLGRYHGQDRDGTWLGKDTMMGSEWRGVKRLRW